MNDFDELDEILNSIKNRDTINSASTDIEPPVKTRAQRQVEEEARIKAEKEARQKAEAETRKKAEEARRKAEEARKKAELEAKLKRERDLAEQQRQEETQRQQKTEAEMAAREAELQMVREEVMPEIEPPKKYSAEENAAEEQLVWFETQEEKNKKEKKNIRFDFKAVGRNFKTVFVPAVKSILKKVFKKQVLLIFGVLVLIAALVFGGIKLYDYSKIAYLKPYQEKYGIEYPAGILEEMCDSYGKNQNVVGRIKLGDTDTDELIISQKTEGAAYSYEGNDVFKNQQFMSFDLNGTADIESVYSTAESFLSSSQKVEITTLVQKNVYRVIAAYYTNMNFEDDNDYVFPYNIYGNLTEKSLNHYADSIKHRNLYDTGYEFSQEDKFVSITADSDFMADFKFVILCVQTDEKKFEKSGKADNFENIRYPQIWYDVNNQENPYWLSAGWYPEMIVNAENGKTKKTTEKDYDFEAER